MTAMYKLNNQVMDYAWGSKTAIANLLGNPVTEAHQAELWMGAHPKAPSGLAGTDATLDRAIAAEPELWLGRGATFGGLPFLLKVLAAAAPLSLQAHPSLAQAQEGFERENAARIPLDAPHRNYRDRNHKPELLCALTPFDALCGFRPATEICALFEPLGVEAFRRVLAPLRAGEVGLRAAFEALMSASRAEQATWVAAVVAASGEVPPSEFSSAYSWARRFNEEYPGDVGVLLSLWLELVHLEPTEAIFLPAGVMHAYLDGTGIEVMANSDNVLRGGLTPKHVDVPELLRVLRFDAPKVQKVVPREVAAGIAVYDTQAPDFELARLTPGTSVTTVAPTNAPEIYLVVEGQARLEEPGGASLTLRRGESAALSAQRGPLQLTGPAVLYRASLPRP